MPEDLAPSPAVSGCPAVAEIAEFARQVPPLDFGPAYRRAVVAALLRAVQSGLPGTASPSATGAFRGRNSEARQPR